MARILIIDDDNRLQEMLQQILEEEGYEVITASDGEEGLQLYTTSQPLLVILDLKMPKIDGLQFLEHIRVTPLDPAIIVLTGQGTDDAMEQCFKKGVNAFMRKPFNFCEFRGLVKNTIALKEAGAELVKHQDNLERIIKERTKELLLEKTRAEEANVAKTQFLIKMNHEMRTPLNGLMSGSEMLLMINKKQLPTNIQNILQMICESGDRVLTSFENIIFYCNLDLGKCHLEEESVNLPQLVLDVFEINQNSARKKNISYAYTLDKRLPGNIHADSSKLFWILKHLVENAIKFSSKEKAVQFDVLSNEQNIVFRIADQGIGITREKQTLIFEPFEQADNSLARDFEGSGLGLAIVKILVKMLDGVIEVQSTLGEGATVTMMMQSFF